jgi:hypothetical protein
VPARKTPVAVDVRVSERHPSNAVVAVVPTVEFHRFDHPEASISIPWTVYGRRLPAMVLGGPKEITSVTRLAPAVRPNPVTPTTAYFAPAGAVAITIGGGVIHAVELGSATAADVDHDIAVPPVTSANHPTYT